MPAKQTKLHAFFIPLERNGEYMELGLFSKQVYDRLGLLL